MYFLDAATPLSVARRRLSVTSDNTLIEGFADVNIADEKDDKVE
jgi:hypothetical protein